MRDLQIGLSHSFEVTLGDPGLNVGFTFYDDSGVTPVQIGVVVPALNWVGMSYRAKFTPASAIQYLVRKATYLDPGLTTIDPDGAQGSDTFRGVDYASLVLDVPIASHNTLGTVGGAIAAAGGASSSSGAPLVGVLAGGNLIGIMNEGSPLVGVLGQE